MSNILILYYANQEYPPRRSVSDHLYAFQNYTSDRCVYINLAMRRLPKNIQKISWDLIVFHTIFLATRWSRSKFKQIMDRVSVLKQVQAVKIALPQDEFINTDLLCDFINEFGINYVFSVAPESEWSQIYATVDFQKVKFFQILTGYLDDKTITRINHLAATASNRTIDIGYRAWRSEAWLGRHGMLKTQIADLFNEKSPSKELITDISTNPEDTFLGNDWHKFLLRCKYTIGVEGGASILDRDGTIVQKTRQYVSLHPQASFEEVEVECFPNLDGTLHLLAISPRHLEACATKTCQILVEGSYNGALIAGKHYIELKQDFSNINEVLDIIKQDELRKEIVDRAYRDIVESGEYSYRGLVKFILEQSLKGLNTRPSSFSTPFRDRLIFQWMQWIDRLSWISVAIYVILKTRVLKVW